MGDRHRFVRRGREFERRRAATLRAAERAHDLARKTYYGVDAMNTMDAIGDARQRLLALFPTRLDHMTFQLQHYAQTMQRFDVTFLDDRPPLLDVHLNRGRPPIQRRVARQEREADRETAEAPAFLRRHHGERRRRLDDQLRAAGRVHRRAARGRGPHAGRAARRTARRDRARDDPRDLPLRIRGRGRLVRSQMGRSLTGGTHEQFPT